MKKSNTKLKPGDEKLIIDSDASDSDKSDNDDNLLAKRSHIS